MNKYNIGRLKRLLAMLKENRYPNFPRFLAEMKKMDVAGNYNLSARTLQRDILFLKSEYNAPIQYDYTQKGYYLTIPDWSIDIPLLEDDEMQAAVLGARLAENILPSPVKQKVRKAVDSLLSVNEKGMDENAALLSLVALGSRISIKPEIFQAVFECWQKHFCIDLTYETITGKRTAYRVEPHVLAFYEGNWYIKVFSILRNGVPVSAEQNHPYVLALHRILSVEQTDKTFIPDQKLIAEVNHRELFVFPKATDIRLKLGPEAFKFIGEQFDFIHEGMDGDCYLVRIESAPIYKIVNYVLVEGGDAKLLNHPEIQKEIIKRAKRCIDVMS